MHELKDHREASRGLIKQFIFQKYDVWMRRQLSKGLNFLQAVDLKKRKSLGSNTRGSKRVWIWELLSHLMQGRKEAFHTFHRVIESIFNILNFQNFAKRSFSFVRNQIVLLCSKTMHDVVEKSFTMRVWMGKWNGKSSMFLRSFVTTLNWTRKRCSCVAAWFKKHTGMRF